MSGHDFSIDAPPFYHLNETQQASWRKPATLERIQLDFGNTSATFRHSMHMLRSCLPALEEQSELQVVFEQWQRFSSIAYGRFNDSPDLFLVHSYLSVFAKLIAYAVLKKQPTSDDQELRANLDGSLFERLNVARFVEDDFFHWVGMEAYNYFLKPAGLLVFVLPRSFFNVDQHDNTRSGVVQSVQLTSAWDLKDVEPLFRVPACVLFARRLSGAGDSRQHR